jgi:hypothetical protein
MAAPAPGRSFARKDLTVLGAYAGVLVVAEGLVAAVDPVSGAFLYQEVGLTVHILLVFALLFHGVLVQSRDPTLSYLLTALSLASLIRVFSLAVPRYTFDILTWLALVSLPLLTAIVAVVYVQGLRPAELGLGPGPWKTVPWQLGIGLTGVPLGLVEFAILREAPWVSSLADVPTVVWAVVVIFVATGISEELIFRGILLKRAVERLGPWPGLLFVSIVFASLHIFFRNVADLLFVFGVGVFYGFAVLRTRSLWGVIGSHSVGNVMLYLVAPFLLGNPTA